MDLDLNSTWTLDMDFGLGLTRTWTWIVTKRVSRNTKMEALEHKILSASVIVVLSLVFGYLPLILAKK